MPTDNFGREVENVSASDLLSDVGKSTTASAVGSEGGPDIEKVASILTQLNKNITQGQKKSEKYLKQIAEAYKKGASKEMQKMAKAATTPGSMNTKDVETHKHLEKMLGLISKLPAGGGAGVGRAFPVGKAAGADMAAEFTRQMDTGKWWKKVASKLSAIGAQALGGIDIMQATFGGIVKDSIDFNIQLKQVGFQTQGITKETRGLVKNWVDLSDVSTRTGLNLTNFQQAYTKNIRKGVVSLKESGEVLKASLNLSTMIGSNAEQTADLLHDWHVQMGLTRSQTEDLSRSIQIVAQETGVTGDNLIQAVKASEKFVKNMRNAGTLTAKAAGEMALLVAEAQKLGIADQMDRVLDAATDVNKLFFTSSQETRNLMFQAAASVGKLSELTTGTITKTRAGRKAMAQGLENILANFGTSFDRIGELSAERLRDINIALQQAYGIQIDEMKRMHEGWLTGTKTLAEMKEELKKTNMTIDERLALEEKLRKTGMARGMQVLALFSDVAKDAKSTESAMTKWMSKLGPEMKKNVGEFAKEMGMAITTPTEKLHATLLFSAEQLKKAGGKDMVAEMTAAIAGGDKDVMRQAIDNLTKEQQKTGVEQIKSLDPMTEMAQMLTEINNTLRALLGPMATGILQMVGPIGLMGLQAGPMIQGVLGIAGMFKGGGLKKLGGEIFSGKIGRRFGDTMGNQVCECIRAAGGVGGGGVGGGVARRELTLGKAVPMAKLAGPKLTGAGMPIIRGAAPSRFERLRGQMGRRRGGLGGMLGGGRGGKKGGILSKIGGLFGGGGRMLGRLAGGLLGGFGGGGGMAGGAVGGAGGAVPVTVVGGAGGLGAGGGVGDMVGGVTKVLGGKGSILGKLMGFAGKIAGPLAIATTAFGALKGAIGGAANAADIHGIAESKLQMSHKVTAGTAGAATGALNALTLGFFDKQLGPKGTWTKAVGGFFQSTWEGIKGIFTGKTVGEKMKNLGKTFMRLTPIGWITGGLMKLFGAGAKGKGKGNKIPKAQHGGVVRETGIAEIHKDERILPKSFLDKICPTSANRAGRGAAAGAGRAGGGLFGGLGALKYMIPIIGPMLAMADMMSLFAGKGTAKTAAPGLDMHDKVRRDQAGAGVGKQDTELAQLREINQGIKRLVGIIQGPDRVGVPPGQEVGSPASMEKGKHAPDYGMWPVGRTGASTTKEFI